MHNNLGRDRTQTRTDFSQSPDSKVPAYGSALKPEVTTASDSIANPVSFSVISVFRCLSRCLRPFVLTRSCISDSRNNFSSNSLARSRRFLLFKQYSRVAPLRAILKSRQRDPENMNLRRKGRKVQFKLPGKGAKRSLFRIYDWREAPIQRWLMIMVLPLTYEMWAFPYRLALCIPSISSSIWYSDLACDGLFWIDGIFSFYISFPPDIDEPAPRFVGAVQRFVFQKLPFEIFPSFLYLFATPFCRCYISGGCTLAASGIQDQVIDMDLAQTCVTGWTIWVWWASTVFRFLPRMLRLSRYITTMETNLDVSVSTLQVFKFSFIIFMTPHWVGCVYFWIARVQCMDGSTWIGAMESMLPLYNSLTAPTSTQYLLCLYRGFSSVTVSYASTIPNNVPEFIFTFAVIVIQIWQTGVILGAIISYTAERDPIVEAHKRFMEELLRFVERKQLPPELKERICKHFEFQHRKAVENQSSRINLPRSLEVKVANSKFRSVLERCTARGQVFQGCNPQFLSALLTRLSVVFLMPDEEVFKRGDLARELCFVYRGACRILNGPGEKVKRVIHHDAPDVSAVVGEVPFFFGVLHGFHCRSHPDGDVQLLVLGKADSEELFSNYPEQLEIIRNNILSAIGLGPDGSWLAGAQEQAEEDPDELAVVESVCEALKNHADETFTALTYSARVGDVEEMQALIRRGANINHVDYDGRGALAMAAVEGNFKVVEALLLEGVDKNCRNRWGQTPLQEAMGARQGPVVELLLQWKAHITDQTSVALCSAASTDDVEQLNRLLDNKANVNLGDYDNRTPLHLAAAEGHDKAAEYLLEHKADPSVEDRWGCTPLQEAVRSGRTMLAILIRAKGGKLPAEVGAMQICTAATKGDVPGLKLLHMCGVMTDVGDYDDRRPLHLASAEARLLAVSFLLVISADPNCQDRWGCTPLDEALRGGTMYHKYCGRLIVAWGGSLGRSLKNTSAGKTFMQELEQIEMEDVRNLIRRLIDAGYDRRVPSSLAEQEICTMFEVGVKQIDLARELRQVFSQEALFLKEQSIKCRSDIQHIQEYMSPICAAIESHPVNQNRKSSVSGLSQQTENMAAEGLSKSSNSHRFGLVEEYNTLIFRSERMEKGLLSEENLFESVDQGLDSDEEEQLHADLDALVEMQERVEAMGGNQNKYMASVFQKVCLQITEIEGMYLDLSNVFLQASACTDSSTMPCVTLNEFAEVLDLMNLSGILQSELEEIFEQGLRHVPFWETDFTRSSQSEGDCISRDECMGQEGYPLAGEREHDEEDEDEDVKVPITKLIVGSPDFRSKIMALATDEAYCFMTGAAPFRLFSRTQISSLSAGGRMRKVATGEIFCMQQHHGPGRDAVLKYSPASAANEAVFRGALPDRTMNRSKSPVRGGSHSTERTSRDSEGGVWFLVISGNLVVEDDPSRIEQKLYSELGPGSIFGGYKTLTDKETPFLIKAIKGCQLLELPLRNLSLLRNEEITDALCLAANMGEAPIDAVVRRGIDSQEIASGDEHDDMFDGHLSETKLHALKVAFTLIDQVWQEICFGEASVPLSQFLAFQPYLGEVGSELFKKLFAVKGLPSIISKSDFWEIWIRFLSMEAYGKRDPANISELHNFEAQNLEKSLHDQEVSEERPNGILEAMHARFFRSRQLKDRFLDGTTIEQFELCFIAVTGDIGVPLPSSKIKVFLEQLFPDFQYPISRHNCQEFMNEFGRDGIKSKFITFADIRKMFLERSKELRAEGSNLIHSTFNPNSDLYQKWLNVVKLVAVLQYIVVPIRLCFSPWNIMTDWRALSIDLPLDILTGVHVLVLSNTAYQNSRAQWVVNRVKLIRRINLQVLMASIPVDWLAFVFGASIEMCNWLRVNKLFLPYHVLIQQKKIGRISARNRLLELFLSLLALLHSAGCTWFYIGTRYKEWYPDSAVSWFESAENLKNVTSHSYADRYGIRNHSTILDRYLISLYWVTSTLSSYGIVGDMLPANNVEILYCMVMMVLNITFYGFIIGEVSTIVMMQDEEVVAARTQLGAVESFVRGSCLEDDLREEIKMHFKATRIHSSTNQTAIFRRMSRCLQVEVSSYTTRGYLDGVPLFQGCSSQLMDAICVLLVEVNFAPEEYLYRASEIARDMYFVVDGSVDEISEGDKGEKIDAVVKSGGTTGVLSFFFGMRRLGSARAGKLAGAVCLRLSRDEFMDMLALYPEEEAKIAQAAMTTFEGARSQFGSRRALSHSPSKAGGSHVAVSAAADATSTNGNPEDSDLEDKNSSEAFTQALGGSGVRLKMAVLKKRREGKRIYGILTAAGKGDIVRLRSSLISEGDCNIHDYFRRTPLHIAASQGQLEAVRFLLHMKADGDARDQFENTPLNEAVRHRHDAVAALIREKLPGCSLSMKGHEIGSLMCQAGFKGDVEHVRRLITNSASPSACDYDQRSALHLGCCLGHYEVAKLLLEAQADPHARDRFGGTPLDDAVRHGHTQLQSLLRGRGAHLSGEFYAYKLCDAASRGDLASIRTLVTNGVDPAVGDYDGRTALHLAASEGEVSVLDYLLELEPRLDVNTVDRLGGTPLEDAIRHGHRVAASMLEAAGGMRRHERRLSELVGRYLVLVAPNRIDTLIRLRRGLVSLRLKSLRAGTVKRTALRTVEAKAFETIREVLLPTIKARVTHLGSLLSKLAGFLEIHSQNLLGALQMQNDGGEGTLRGKETNNRKHSISQEMSIQTRLQVNSVAREPKKPGQDRNQASRCAALDVLSSEMWTLKPRDTVTQLLVQLPEISAAIQTAREALEAPLPRCKLVQMCSVAFRRDTIALRVEARNAADTARLLKRALRAAEVVFRTRTFRAILRKSMSRTSSFALSQEDIKALPTALTSTSSSISSSRRLHTRQLPMSPLEFSASTLHKAPTRMDSKGGQDPERLGGRQRERSLPVGDGKEREVVDSKTLVTTDVSRRLSEPGQSSIRSSVRRSRGGGMAGRIGQQRVQIVGSINTDVESTHG